MATMSKAEVARRLRLAAELLAGIPLRECMIAAEVDDPDELPSLGRSAESLRDRSCARTRVGEVTIFITVSRREPEPVRSSSRRTPAPRAPAPRITQRDPQLGADQAARDLFDFAHGIAPRAEAPALPLRQGAAALPPAKPVLALPAPARPVLALPPKQGQVDLPLLRRST